MIVTIYYKKLFFLLNIFFKLGILVLKPVTFENPGNDCKTPENMIIPITNPIKRAQLKTI